MIGTLDRRIGPPERQLANEGRLTFKNYQTRYRPGLQLVLRGVDADIMPGEKVGIP